MKIDKLLNENGDLIGHPLEMQLRQRFREVCRHHAIPSNGVAEADMVRSALAEFSAMTEKTPTLEEVSDVVDTELTRWGFPSTGIRRGEMKMLILNLKGGKTK